MLAGIICWSCCCCSGSIATGSHGWTNEGTRFSRGVERTAGGGGWSCRAGVAGQVEARVVFVLGR